jgi:hypothetical protein
MDSDYEEEISIKQREVSTLIFSRRVMFNSNPFGEILPVVVTVELLGMED